MWNSEENVFSRSASFSGEVEDEKALRWAALKRLLTYARVRRGIFKDMVGETREVGLSELPVSDQRLFLERLVNSVEEDSEKFFHRMRKRFDARSGDTKLDIKEETMQEVLSEIPKPKLQWRRFRKRKALIWQYVKVGPVTRWTFFPAGDKRTQRANPRQ